MTQQDEMIRTRIVSALTDYDRKQSTRRGYNHYALAMYLGALQDAAEMVGKGKTWPVALDAVFNDRVLAVAIKAIG